MVAVRCAAGCWSRAALLSHYALLPDRNHRNSVLCDAFAHGRELATCWRLFALARPVLLVRLGDPSSVSHTLALLAASLALFIAMLSYAERTTGGASPRSHRRHRPHGQMELPARGAESWRGACRDEGDAGVLSRAAHAS